MGQVSRNCWLVSRSSCRRSVVVFFVMCYFMKQLGSFFEAVRVYHLLVEKAFEAHRVRQERDRPCVG